MLPLAVLSTYNSASFNSLTDKDESHLTDAFLHFKNCLQYAMTLISLFNEENFDHTASFFLIYGC